VQTLQKTTIEISVDSHWYLTTYPDAAEAIQRGIYKSALDHYLKIGFRTGYLPAEPAVDERWYLNRYPDVAEAVRAGKVSSATTHYVRSGYAEGRFPSGDHPGAYWWDVIKAVARI
jgi:hypothetical protein